MSIKAKIKRFKDYSHDGTLKQHLWISFFVRIKWIYNLISPFCKVKKNKIVLSNFVGLGYGCNPKYIAQYILEHNLSYELIWLADDLKCRNSDLIPQQIKKVKLYSFSALYELSTAGVWIDNVRKSLYPKKKKNQIYIQTWHGTFPTKKIEKDASTLPKEYQKMAIKDSRMIDGLLSGSQIKTETYKSNFYYNGEILNIGQPRDDIFFDKIKIKESEKRIKEYLKLPKDNKIILYAPTFRQGYSLEPYKLDYEKVLGVFEAKFGVKCSFVSRLHPNMVQFADKLKVPSFVVNATTYPDMQELLCAADFIISDYSSTLDFSLFNKPIFLFCSDYEEYKKNERDFYISLEDLPFPFALTNEGLCENIKSFDEEKYIKMLTDAYKKYGLFDDGHAYEKVMAWLENKRAEIEKR